MRPSAKLVAVLFGISRVMGLVVAITPLIALGLSFPSAAPDRPQLSSGAINEARGDLLSSVASESPRVSNHWGITRYLMGFAGDRSLNVATVVEQARSGYARYTVRLQLSSGSDQSIAVIAPPGGLRPEVLDMTGDGIRNDLVLTPRLLNWPLTVLLNDGHDHFVVAISGSLPGSWGSQDAASGTRDVQSGVALLSSGFRADCLSDVEGTFHAPLCQTPFSPIARTASGRSGQAVRLGRAPPLV
jgi:hypothetical protein